MNKPNQLEELVSGLLRPKLFPFGKSSKAKPAAQQYIPLVKLVSSTHDSDRIL